MSVRGGVSLIEVLVSMVLLAIGIAGTLSALTASSRLRERARMHEELAAEAMDRLAWFESRACAQLDTAESHTTARGVRVEWHVRDSLGRRQLSFDANTLGRTPERLSLRTSWQCG